jgi:ABC-2 type transport system ATP-binding protein
MPDLAVTVNDLTRKFGDFVAVDNITFSVPRGEIFGFLGPNGAGKSTTIRMLCGIIEPTAGNGTVVGYDIRTQAEEIKQRIGYMSQKFSLYEDLTVAENIEFYAGVYGLTQDRFLERKRWILRMANLAERENSLTSELAMGWKQRLALGCAVVHEPEVLFLDEPTAGVDPVARRNFWELIYDVAGRGVTVFVTTHYMDEAEHCDRLALIYRGKLTAIGSSAELKRHYATGTLFEVAAEPVMKALDALRADARVRDVAVFGRDLHVVMPAATDAAEYVRQTLAAAGVAVSHVEAIIPSLEDVFVALVEEADRTAGEG